jgi:multicomponent Na+:H+ antiporter subunit G
MAALVPWLADALILAGLFVMSVAVYGLVWMPDLYTRLHAASKAALLGVLPILITATLTGDPTIGARAVLLAVFLVLTTPVATHAIGRGAYLARERMRTPGAIDESGCRLAPRDTRPTPS